MTAEEKRYEITCVDPYMKNYGKSEILTETECIARFGKDEWPEYREGYLPHIAVSEL